MIEIHQHPFHIFPRETWEIILEDISDQKDIENLFVAIPKLGNSFGDKKFSWMMEKVMPFLASNYLSVGDLLTCRLASKRWRNSVNVALETHPDRLPYKSTRLGVIHGENHICYNAVPRINPNIEAIMRSGQDENIRSCSFPGRYLNFFIKEYNVSNFQGITLAEAVTFLKKFGPEIWYIRFKFNFCSTNGDCQNLLQLQRQFLECLSLLPNLKSLEIEGGFAGFHGGNILTEMPNFVMHTSLETIKLGFATAERGFLRELLQVLAGRNQVQKLGIYHSLWDNSLAHLFPNLRELCIYMRDVLLENLDQLLSSLRFSPLQKLCINSGHTLNISDILRNIAAYKIEYLTLISNGLNEKQFSISTFSAPHLRHLEIRITPESTFYFIQFIPNLEYFVVSQNWWVAYPQNFSHSTRVNYRFTNIVGSFKDYFHNHRYLPQTLDDIWEALPNLKMLTVYGASDGYRRRYIREDRQRIFTSFVSNRHRLDYGQFLGLTEQQQFQRLFNPFQGSTMYGAFCGI